MQRSEYGIYKYLWRVYSFIANAVLRGEVHASEILTRIIQTRLMFIQGPDESGDGSVWEPLDMVVDKRTK